MTEMEQGGIEVVSWIHSNPWDGEKNFALIGNVDDDQGI